MRDFILTLVVFFVLFKVFNEFSRFSSRNQAPRSNSPDKDGNSQSKEKKISDSEGEYVDYEEIKD